MTGRMADAVLAAYQAGEIALRLLKPKTEVREYTMYIRFACGNCNLWKVIMFQRRSVILLIRVVLIIYELLYDVLFHFFRIM